MTTPNIPLETVPANTLQPSVPVNDAMQVLDALVRPGGIVQSMAETVPPTTTSGDVGKRWIVGGGATSAWLGKDGQIALCTAAGLWRYFTPTEGWQAYSIADAADVRYDGASWSEAGSGGSAADVAYDNTESGLDADSVQAAIDELAAIPGGGGIQSIVAGTNITVNSTDPANPIISATSGGGGGRGYAVHRIKQPGSYFFVNDHGGTPAAISAASNRLFYTPFSVERAMVVTGLLANVTTVQAAAHRLRMGIYAHDESSATHRPGALIAQTGDMSGSALGDVTGALSATLLPGVIYWAAICNSVSIGFRCFPFANFPIHWMGRPGPAVNAANNHYYEGLSSDWTQLPANASGSLTVASANVPGIMLVE